MDVPELTDDLLDRLVGQSDDQAAGATIRELEALRDDCLVSVMQGLRTVGYGAGEVLADYERALFDRAPAPTADGDLSQPLKVHEVRIPTDWVDYNGHTNDSRYAQLSGDAADAFLRYIGVDAEYLRGGHSYYTVESHISYIAQSHAGDVVYVTAQVMAHDAKRLHLFNRILRSDDHSVIATGEHMYLHVDTEVGKTVPAPQYMIDRIATIANGQAGLDRPPQAGRFVGAPRT